MSAARQGVYPFKSFEVRHRDPFLPFFVIVLRQQTPLQEKSPEADASGDLEGTVKIDIS